MFEKWDNIFIPLQNEVDKDILEIWDNLHLILSIEEKAELVSYLILINRPQCKPLISFLITEIVKDKANFNTFLDELFSGKNWTGFDNCRPFFEFLLINYSNEVLKFIEETCLSTKENLIERKFSITHVLSLFPTLLLTAAIEWHDKTDLHKIITLECLQRYLSDLQTTDKETPNEPNIEKCYEILIKLSIEKGLGYGKIIEDEKRKYYQCFKLLSRLRYPEENIDYEQALQNIKNFKNIEDHFGEDWIRCLQKKSEMHPLIYHLSKTNENKKSLCCVKLIDELLSNINHNEQGGSKLLRKLKSIKEYQTALSELFVISRLKRKFDIIIEPRIKNKSHCKDKTPDLELHYKDKRVILEVLQPDAYTPLKYATGKTMGIPNFMANKIWDKFRSNIENLDGVEEVPILLILDLINQLPFAEKFIEDYFKGDPVYSFKINTKTLETIDIGPRRKISEKTAWKGDPRMVKLSGVIGYRLILIENNDDMKFSLKTCVIENPMAINKLDNELLEHIVGTLQLQ